MNDISKRNVKETLKCSVIKNLRLLEPKITMQEIADWLGVTKAHVGKWEYGDANMSRSSMFTFLDRILQRRMAYKLALEGFLDTADEKNKAFDLLDALSKSGSISLDAVELHIVIASTHCFVLQIGSARGIVI